MNFAAFFSYIFISAITPGPNNIMSMTNAGKYGLKKAFPFNIGVLIGSTVTMSSCALFSSLLYEFIPAAKPIMLCIGAAYLLRLAYSIWRDKPHSEKKGLLSRTNSVSTGIVLQFVNIKMILYAITALSSFVLPYYRSFPAVAGFTAILILAGFSGNCCWALFGAAFQRFFQKHAKPVNAVMALLLVYCAVTMLMEIPA